MTSFKVKVVVCVEILLRGSQGRPAPAVLLLLREPLLFLLCEDSREDWLSRLVQQSAFLELELRNVGTIAQVIHSHGNHRAVVVRGRDILCKPAEGVRVLVERASQ